MLTLMTVAGRQARIFTLPNRPDFMLAADLATVYGTEPKRLAEAVKRNPERFPDDFCFRLTEQEEEAMWSQIATTSARKRDDLRPLAFTHIGAYALSGVLKTEVAAAVSVEVHRAFAAMERAQMEAADAMLFKLRTEQMRAKPIRVLIVEAVRAGLPMEAIRRTSSYPRWRLEDAARECLATGLIDRLPEGMETLQKDLFHG